MSNDSPKKTGADLLPLQEKGGYPIFLRRPIVNAAVTVLNAIRKLQVKVAVSDGVNTVLKDAVVNLGDNGMTITLPAVAAVGSGGSGAAAGGVNAQTASYTAVSGDSGFLISFSSSSALTLTLPSTPPSSSWFCAVQCVGAGGLTISPNSLNLDGGSASLILIQGQGCLVYTDGTNYFTTRGLFPPQQFKIQSDGGDYWNCKTWDGTTLGSATIKVAKPYKLRAANGPTSETIRGTTYTYTYALTSGEYVRTTSVSGSAITTDYITPPALSGDIISAQPFYTNAPSTLTGVLWMAGQDSRAWAS